MYDTLNRTPKTPKRMYDTPKRMNDTPKKTYDTLNRTPKTPKRMNDTPKRMNDTPKRMNNTPKRMNDTLKRMYDTPKRMNDSLKREPDTEQEKYILTFFEHMPQLDKTHYPYVSIHERLKLKPPQTPQTQTPTPQTQTPQTPQTPIPQTQTPTPTLIPPMQTPQTPQTLPMQTQTPTPQTVSEMTFFPKTFTDIRHSLKDRNMSQIINIFKYWSELLVPQTPHTSINEAFHWIAYDLFVHLRDAQAHGYKIETISPILQRHFNATLNPKTSSGTVSVSIVVPRQERSLIVEEDFVSILNQSSKQDIIDYLVCYEDGHLIEQFDKLSKMMQSSNIFENIETLDKATHVSRPDNKPFISF
jgi:hypothetical protein